MKAPDAFRTISEVAEELELPQHVLRFWETRFTQIKPMKRGGGRRYYRPEDVDLLRGIRLLLYGEGFTIKGVQRIFKEKGIAFVVSVGQTGVVETVTPDERDADDPAPRRKRSKAAPQAAAPDAEPDAASATATAPAEDAAGDAGEAEAAAPEPIVVTRIQPPVQVPMPPRTVFRLQPEQRRRMEAVLADLLEAKRILEQVRQ
jgi:DNA-binding transcriptional MerR regulator